jgi:hypothetical protein
MSLPLLLQEERCSPFLPLESEGVQSIQVFSFPAQLQDQYSLIQGECLLPFLPLFVLQG